MNFSYWENKHLLNDIDYLVVGMGLVGLQSAINIKEKHPSARVVAVDRFAWSLGASTRNAGFACFANVSEIIDDIQNQSIETVYQLAAKRYKGLQLMRKNFGDDQIGYEEKGSVEVFTRENKADLEKAIDSIQSVNSILYQTAGLEDVFHYSSNANLPHMIGGIHNKYEGQINTGKLYKSIYDHAQKQGVELLGGFEVKSWEKIGDKIQVVGQNDLLMKTSNLVLCTNGFSEELGIEGVVPARGQVILTEVLEKLPCEGIHNYDKGYYYWRDIDGRILLGGARNFDAKAEHTDLLEENEKIVSELKRFLFEEICGKEVKIEQQWSGIMGMGKSNEKSPIVKEVEPHVFVAARLGGMGVALSALVAEELAAMI